jgi:hypothetical protein
MLDARNGSNTLQTSRIGLAGMTRAIAAAWQRLNALGPDHGQPYEDLATADKRRYAAEMVEWNELQAALALGARAVEDSCNDCSEETGHDNGGTATHSDASLASGASNDDHTSTTADMDMDLDLLNLMDEWNLALNLDDDLFGP